MTARRPAGRSANVARGPWWKPIGPDRSADGPLMGSPESRRAAPERSTWAAAHPSTGHEGRVEAGRERVEDAEPGHDRAGAGADAASVAVAGVAASVTGRGLAELAGRLATVGRPAQGIADGRGRRGTATRCASRPTGAVPTTCGGTPPSVRVVGSADTAGRGRLTRTRQRAPGGDRDGGRRRCAAARG